MKNINKNMNRRNFLKLGAVFAAIPLIDNAAGRGKLFANSNISKYSLDLVRNGEVITGAHWGILKVTIRDGKVVDSTNAIENKTPNPLQGVTKDLIYTQSRIRYPMVRKSYIENPDSPKPELRGKDEWVKVDYNTAIKLIAQELKKHIETKEQVESMLEVMAGIVLEECTIVEYCYGVS